jgi:hypothetical protein
MLTGHQSARIMHAEGAGAAGKMFRADSRTVMLAVILCGEAMAGVSRQCRI